MSEPSRDGTHSRARGRQAHGQSPTKVGRFSRRGQCRVTCSCIWCLLAGRRVAADARSAWTERLGECCRAAVWAGIGSEDNTTQHIHDKHVGKTARHDSKSNRLTPAAGCTLRSCPGPGGGTAPMVSYGYPGCSGHPPSGRISRDPGLGDSGGRGLDDGQVGHNDPIKPKGDGAVRRLSPPPSPHPRPHALAPTAGVRMMDR